MLYSTNNNVYLNFSYKNKIKKFRFSHGFLKKELGNLLNKYTNLFKRFPNSFSFKNKRVFIYTKLVYIFEEFSRSNFSFFLFNNYNKEKLDGLNLTFLNDLFLFFYVLFDRKLFRNSVF